MAQILGIVGIVGYLSYRSGQQAVEDLAHQLMEEAGDHISHDLDIYLQTAHRINQSNIAALESGAISLDNLDQLHRYLIMQHRQLPEFTTQLLGTPQGDFRTIHWVSPAEVEAGLTQLQPTDLPFEAGHSDANDSSQLELHTVDLEGNLVRYLNTIENIDVRARPWYRRAVETGTPGWKEPFQIGASNLLAINAYAPFYDASQQIEGVFSVNLSLERLNDFLKMLSVSKNGQVFIMERNGLLIADSIEFPVYILSEVESDSTQSELSATQPGQIEFRRLSALESSDSVMKAAAQQLEKTFSSLDAIQSAQEIQINIDDEARSEGLRQRHFLSVIPYQDDHGLDWLIVTVVPESDFMAQIHANVQRNVLLCVAALVGAIALAIWISRKVSNPVLALNQAMQEFADNTSHSSVHPTQIQEIESLRQAFHQMASHLNDSFRALKTSEQKFSTFVKNLPMGVSVHNALGQVMFINQQGVDILPLGTTPTLPEQLSEVYQLYIAGTNQLYPTDQLPAIRGIRGEKGHTNDIEVEVNGRRVPIEVYTTPIFDETGQVIYAINAFQDISERRQLEAERERAQEILTHYNRTLESDVAQKTEALRHSEALLNEAQRIARMGSWSWNLESDERWWSPQMYEMVGLDPDEYTVPPDIEIANQNIHPEDRERVNQTTKDAIEQGISYEIEFRILRPDGSITHAFSKGLVERNAEGQIIRFWGINQDISDRKQAEFALQQTTQQLQAFLDNAPAMIFLFNAEGQYLRVNLAFEDMLGIPESQIVGRSFADFWPESVVKTMKSRIQILIETGQPLEVEDEIDLNGDRRTFQSILFPVVTLDEIPATFWAIAIDITERKAVEQMKDEFISVVSHELRTPLTTIHGSLGLLAAGIYDSSPTKAKRMLDIAAIDCERLVRLVNEVLTLERLESNRLQMEKSICDVTDLIQQAVDGMQAIAEQASITLVTETISAQIWANPDAILQTLTNLLSNAIKFSPAQSTVSVAADIQTDIVKFRVSDRGRGIPPDKLKTIFERFQQVDASDSRQKGGTGLGLAICQSFITQHGGKIWAESTVGEGSTFYFTVAIADTDAP
ncbi:MAG TPA: PAS domain S-box protein [Elainellaceae cyanobacterium]